MNKKAMFFTILVIIILFIFVASFSVYELIKDNKSSKVRVTTMNSLLDSLEKDLSRRLYISGYRSLLICNKNIIVNGTYDSDIKYHLTELISNGTFNGKPESIMASSTTPDIQEAVKARVNTFDADINFANNSLTISQDDPWHVKFTLTYNFDFSEESNQISWNKTESLSSYVPIYDFEDPFYILSSSSLMTNTFRKSPFSTFVSGSDITNLLNHTLESYYIHSSSAPSFLLRLEGKNVPDPNGVESIVNLQEAFAAGYPVYEKSAVDYIYFSSQTPLSKRVSGMPSWFFVDSQHYGIYNVTNIVI